MELEELHREVLNDEIRHSLYSLGMVIACQSYDVVKCVLPL